MTFIDHHVSITHKVKMTKILAVFTPYNCIRCLLMTNITTKVLLLKPIIINTFKIIIIIIICVVVVVVVTYLTYLV